MRDVRDWTATARPGRQPRNNHSNHNNHSMPKSAAPRAQRRKYVPPATAAPKAVCVHLVRPDGKVLMLQQDDGVYSDPGGRIERGERWDERCLYLGR